MPTDARPRVALGMPHYGTIHAGTMRAWMDAGSGGRVRVVSRSDSCGSVLCHSFNRLLAVALDARDRGEATHFAMLHADVEPLTVGWLDTLWLQMESVGADLISAIIPIKERERRQTSTAIGRASDPWLPPRNILTSDWPRMPATFTPADVCGEDEVLLLNTGCWLADLRRPWWDGFAFQTPTRIERDADGRRVCRFRPEDWEMSRVLHAAGAKLAGTWTIPVAHHGDGAWTLGR